VCLRPDIGDVNKQTLDSIREWYRVYKVASGKKPNSYLDNGEAKDRKLALKIIEGAHKSWKRLVSTSVKN